MRGDRRGTTLGFPTANLELHHAVRPPAGVYSAEVPLEGRHYRALVNIGTRPTFGQDGAEALEFIFRTGAYAGRPDQNPKLLLLNTKLPKVDGVGVLKRIKTDERTRAIPVVIVAASAERGDILECYKHGANSCLLKPAGVEKFSETLARASAYWMVVNRSPPRASG